MSVKFIPRKDRPKNRNQAGKYAKNMIKSERERYVSGLGSEYRKILDNGAVYLPSFFCRKKDYTLFNKLFDELKNNDVVGWSKHYKFENPDFSPTFNEIVDKMAKHFNVDVIQTRLNVYKDGRDWKPFHHDKHAYADKREDFTMGASFGCSRELEFLHEDTKSKFSFPQYNGDVFAFTSDINKSFMHGVPKSKQQCGKRISIIAWGQKN